MKQRKYISLIALLLLFSMLLTVFTGCGYRKEREKERDLRAVGKVGKYTVTYDELFYLAMTYRDVMKGMYGEDIFDTEESREAYREELEELVYRNITANYAVFALAEEIRYTEADVQEMVDDSMQSLVESLGGMHEYRKMLHENYMTDHFLRRNSAASILQSNILNSYVYYLGLIESDADKICEIIMKGSTYIRTRHIAIFKDNGKTNAENRQTMEHILAELAAGADFDALVETYGEDVNLTDDGYYFMRGEMQEAYEEAAFALSVGETTGIVEGTDGFYIIRRLEKQREYVFLNCYGEGSPLYENYQKYTLVSMIDEQQATMDFVPNSYGASLDLTTLRQGMFWDWEYAFCVLGWILAGAVIVALIAWWCVVSMREDRKSKPNGRQGKNKTRSRK
ncbi:MAG: peptidylprolyl isomerase [Clostridia bacterium]|nr:peptidylprolyl isomerase [Clostridia bacterium]